MKKKIVFIRFCIFKHGYEFLKPMAFPIIDSLTDKEAFEIAFIDEQIQELPETIDADIIAFSVETITAKKAYLMAKKYKKDNNIIVMGGFHPSIEPDESLNYADSVLIGDAEDTWIELLNDIKEGKEIKKKYQSNYSCELKKIDQNFKPFKDKRYPGFGSLYFSRGCKFNCDFCSIKAMYKKGVRHKTVDDIIEEIKQIKEKFIVFIDDNLFVNEELAFDLFQKMKPLKKLWTCQISIDVAKNNKLLKAMKECGCVFVLIGFESVQKDTLKRMNKVANLSYEDYEIAIKNLYKYGIMIHATFVLGYDSDTKESIKNTFDFAQKYHFTKASFNMLAPAPQTPLYKRLKEENRLLMDNWWINNNYHYGDPVYQPKNISPTELKSLCIDMQREYYKPKNILIRCLKNMKYSSFLGNLFLLYDAISAIKSNINSVNTDNIKFPEEIL